VRAGGRAADGAEIFSVLTMLTIQKRCAPGVPFDAELVLPFELRQKSRLRTHSETGEEVGLFLPRGEWLRGGDFLEADDGRVVRVTAKHEKVLHIGCPDGMQLARIAYHLGNRHVPLQIGEGWLRGVSWPATVVAGALVFALAKLLKWWAIVSLGSRWTFRVIVVPGDTRVVSGPYRCLRHPNYVGVIGELVGVAAMTGATLAGVLAVLVCGALLVRRIAVEERALQTMAAGTAPD